MEFVLGFEVNWYTWDCDFNVQLVIFKMGKQPGKKKKPTERKCNDANDNQSKIVDNSPKAYDKDTEVFITMSQEMKEEGNKLFQKRDHEGAMLKYEKALKLLPRNHIDVAYLRSNMAACYMQMGLTDYPRAIHECNLALEFSPKYSKALLKRARCYEALNRLDLALRDVTTVLNMEPNNLMALEISERVEKASTKKGIKTEDNLIDLAPVSVAKEKARKKKREKSEKKTEDTEDKLVVEENIGSITKTEEPKKTVKLAFGEDIRWAQIPFNCSLMQLMEVIRNRFSTSKAVHIKYKDQEGDFITITTDEELRWAESSAHPQGSIKLYIVEVDPEQDPFFGKIQTNGKIKKIDVEQNKGSCYIDDWIIEFARIFKNHVGFDSDSYLDLHELGMKLYSDAMEETITNEDAQHIFDIAAEKFQEMAALAMFNWGNVHMSRARKGVCFKEDDDSTESVHSQIKSAYDWAQKEYIKAGEKYDEAIKIKPDFYEGFLAVGQQQFEQARLSWYYQIACNMDLDTSNSTEILKLYNNAEENMEKGTEMWEELEENRLTELSKPNKGKIQLKKMDLDTLLKNVSQDEALNQAENMRSQINLLWGTMLYERSIVEFKLGLPVWQECLEIAVEKFDLAGASPTDLAVMIKNHCSNNNALEGLGFKIDEIVQAWNEMYEAKRWKSGVPSFRLEPLFRRRIPRIYQALEHA